MEETVIKLTPAPEFGEGVHAKRTSRVVHLWDRIEFVRIGPDGGESPCSFVRKDASGPRIANPAPSEGETLKFPTTGATRLVAGSVTYGGSPGRPEIKMDLMGTRVLSNRPVFDGQSTHLHTTVATEYLAALNPAVAQSALGQNLHGRALAEAVRNALAQPRQQLVVVVGDTEVLRTLASDTAGHIAGVAVIVSATVQEAIGNKSMLVRFVVQSNEGGTDKPAACEVAPPDPFDHGNKVSRGQGRAFPIWEFKRLNRDHFDIIVDRFPDFPLGQPPNYCQPWTDAKTPPESLGVIFAPTEEEAKRQWLDHCRTHYDLVPAAENGTDTACWRKKKPA